MKMPNPPHSADNVSPAGSRSTSVLGRRAILGTLGAAGVAAALTSQAGTASAQPVVDAQTAVSALKYVPKDWDPATRDVSTYVQRVIDEAAVAGGAAIVYWPASTVVAEIQLKSNVRIVGATQGSSIIQAVAGSSNPGIIMLDQTGGPVTRCTVENLSISGVSTNRGQWGMYFKCPPRTVAPFDHGIWRGSFRNVFISNTFPGGIWLYGGGQNSLGPHQFLNFDNVAVQYTDGAVANASPEWIGILATGQVGQVVWNQLESSYRGNGYGANAVSILRETDDAQKNVSDKACYAMSFNACTFQGCTININIERACGITFNGCWIEDGQSGFRVRTASYANVFSGCDFMDTSHNGGTGYIGRVEDVSSAVVISPNIQNSGEMDYDWSDRTTTGYLKVIGGRTQAAWSREGFPKAFAAAATVDIGSNEYLALSGPTAVQTLTTTLDDHSLLVIRATSAITLTPTGGNIRFPAGWGDDPRTFDDDSRLVFHYDKGTNQFTLVAANTSATRAGAFEQISADGSGYFGMVAQSAAAEAPTTGARLYSQVDSSGKNQLLVRFPTGAPIVVAAEA